MLIFCLYRELVHEENKSDDVPTFNLSDITCTAFEFLRDHVYGLNPSITSENVIDILTMTEQYQLLSIQDCCIKYILSSMANIAQSKQKHQKQKFNQKGYIALCLNALCKYEMMVNLYCYILVKPVERVFDSILFVVFFEFVL